VQYGPARHGARVGGHECAAQPTHREGRRRQRCDGAGPTRRREGCGNYIWWLWTGEGVNRSRGELTVGEAHSSCPSWLRFLGIGGVC
jgi:hypothetical protein